MLKFTEPEEEYKTEKCLEKNNRTKINLLLFLIFLSSVLLFLVQGGVVDFYKKEAFEAVCSERANYIRADDDQIKIKKAQKVLGDNLKSFEKMTGYEKSMVKMENNFQAMKSPVIYLSFEGEIEEKRAVPETLCGYKVLIENE